MDTENPRDRVLTAEQRLLAEGIPSYIDAMMAIQELQQTIQKRCRGVLRAGLEEFARAIGMTLDATKIGDYSHPEKISKIVMRGWVYIGVKIPLLNAGTAFVALSLANEIQGYVAIQLKDSNLCTRMGELAQREEQRVEWDSQIIELYKDFPPDLMSSFDDILSDLMGEWSRLWQRVGTCGSSIGETSL